jgi:hypothetical protein
MPSPDRAPLDPLSRREREGEGTRILLDALGPESSPPPGLPLCEGEATEGKERQWNMGGALLREDRGVALGD